LISAGVSKEERGNTLVYTDHELPRMTRGRVKTRCVRQRF
jgi:hypothetical protein